MSLKLLLHLVVFLALNAIGAAQVSVGNFEVDGTPYTYQYVNFKDRMSPLVVSRASAASLCSISLEHRPGSGGCEMITNSKNIFYLDFILYIMTMIDI